MPCLQSFLLTGLLVHIQNSVRARQVARRLRGGLERLRPREAVRLELARVAAVDALAPVVVRLRDARVVTNARHARTVRGAGRVEAVL